MHIYDTIIIGSGYMSAGFSVTKGNCIICERTELCDAHFGASLCCNKISDYRPETVEGNRLYKIFDSMKLIKDGFVNINASECALSEYIIEKELEVLLKCRVIDIASENGIFSATVITNSGIDKIYAKKVMDFSCEGKDYLTVQFISNDIENDITLLENEFGKISYEKTFYENRYALFVPSQGLDINTLKLEIYEKWHKSGTKAKILHIPSAMFSKKSGKVCDDMFDNFFEAFEYGIKEAEKICH